MLSFVSMYFSYRICPRHATPRHPACDNTENKTCVWDGEEK